MIQGRFLPLTEDETVYQYASVENLYPYTILRSYELKQHETNNQGRLTRVNLNMVPGTAPKPEFIGATEVRKCNETDQP